MVASEKSTLDENLTNSTAKQIRKVKKFTDEEVNQIITKLRGMPEIKKEVKYSKSDVIKILSNDIIELQKKGYTLDKIADTLKGEGFELKTSTLRGYLGKFKPKYEHVSEQYVQNNKKNKNSKSKRSNKHNKNQESSTANSIPDNINHTNKPNETNNEPTQTTVNNEQINISSNQSVNEETTMSDKQTKETQNKNKLEDKKKLPQNISYDEDD